MPPKGSIRYKRRLLELTLDEVDLSQVGGRRGVGDHLITARLIWPRPLIAERIALRTVELSCGKADWTSKAWCERVLFKETVEGRLGIEISVSERVSKGHAAEFMSFAGSAVNKLAASELIAASDSVIAGRLWAVPFNYLANVAGQQTKESSLSVIARGVFDLGTDEPTKAGEWFDIVVSMIAPSEIRDISKVRRHGQAQIKRRTALRKGENNGTVRLRGWFYE
ncbi:MAG: hypothetical protein JXN60_00790 [Lentisphaerae bacterium]|nr:hypothetical protein [Lentisphaerota bacterium]